MLMVGSLFAGIGGLDLGLERAGMQVKWQVENNPYCIRVLAKHWPSVKRYGDIKQIKWSEVEPVDLICGGFPCQPVSVAGARKGDKDERWLWLEFLRAIREVRPRYALVENVPGLLSTDDGRLAREVFGDLAEIGYDAEWNIVSATDVGAPHLRKRIFIVAYSSESRTRLEVSGNRRQERIAPRIFKRAMVRQEYREIGSEGIVASHSMENSRCLVGEARAEIEGIISGFIGEGDSCSESAGSSETQSLADSEGRRSQTRSVKSGKASQDGGLDVVGYGEDVPDPDNTKDTACGNGFDGERSEIDQERTGFAFGRSVRYSGFEQQWAVEPDVGRVADGVSHRVDRLRCIGNAVVPQVAQWIGERILESIEL